MLDCVLISSDEAFRHAVMGIIRQPKNKARLALDLPVSADSLSRDSLASVLRAKPKVVFLDLGGEPHGVGEIQTITRDAPEVALVVGGPSLSAEGLLAVMRAGASEYLPRPFSQEETEAAFLRARRRALASTSEKAEILGKVCTVFSAKGGTGVTTITTNLAVALRTLTEKEVLLLDLAPALGTAAVAMGVHPRYSYVDVVQNFHRIDEELLRSFLEVDESGVHVLASPFVRVGEEVLSAEELAGLIDICRQLFDYVVVDGGSILGAHLDPLLELSDERLMVVTPDLPSLRNLKRALDLHGRSNGKPPPKLILNQFKEGMGLSAQDVEDGLGQRLALILERDDMRVLHSLNVGRPEVQVGKSKFAKRMRGLGRDMAGSENLISIKKGFFEGLLGSRRSTGRRESEKGAK